MELGAVWGAIKDCSCIWTVSMSSVETRCSKYFHVSSSSAWARLVMFDEPNRHPINALKCNLVHCSNVKFYFNILELFKGWMFSVWCRYLPFYISKVIIVKAWKQRTKIRMGRLPFSHVRMNYFWWAKTERIVVYSAVNLLFRNNKIQLSKCHYITIFMNCKISLTYISETHWKQSIKFQIESMFHFPFS